MMNTYKINLTHDVDGIKYNTETTITDGKLSHIITVNFDTKNMRGVLNKILADFDLKGFKSKRDLYFYLDNKINGIDSVNPLTIIVNGNPVFYKIRTNIEDYKEYGWTSISILVYGSDYCEMVNLFMN